MTDDLISRAEAMKELQMCAEYYKFAHEAHGFATVEWCENLIPGRKAMETLRNLPTVDAEPVRHGHWIVEWETDDTRMLRCSKCRTIFNVGKGRDGNWCPECGARMDEE